MGECLGGYGVMGVYAGPTESWIDLSPQNSLNGLVTNGLVLALDAGRTLSYPGSGTTWTDLSGNGNNGTLVNGVGYSGDNLGSLVFDGVNDYFTTPLSVGDANTSFTFGGFAKIIASGGSNFFLFSNYLINNTSPFFAIAVNSSASNTFLWFRNNGGTPSTQSTSVSISLNTWNYFIGVRDHISNQIRFYVNSTLISENSFLGSYSVKSTTNNFGGVNHLINYINCNIGLVQLYNRALTASEIQQNFIATRSRFSI
jgi:hypothetical protein